MTGNFKTWPDRFGDVPVDCCLSASPCAFHQQFPAAIRSPLRSQDNEATPVYPATAASPIITPPVVDPPAPAPVDPVPVPAASDSATSDDVAKPAPADPAPASS